MFSAYQSQAPASKHGIPITRVRKSARLPPRTGAEITRLRVRFPSLLPARLIRSTSQNRHVVYPASGVLTAPVCGGTDTADGSLGQAAGYEATPVCGDPVCNTLDLIDSDFGAVTLTATGGGQWVGTKIIGGVTYTWTFSPSSADVSSPFIMEVSKSGASAKSTAHSFTCGPFGYTGSGVNVIGTLYPSGTGSWTIADSCP